MQSCFDRSDTASEKAQCSDKMTDVSEVVSILASLHFGQSNDVPSTRNYIQNFHVCISKYFFCICNISLFFLLPFLPV